MALTLSRLRRTLPGAVVVSARTGEGLGDLLDELVARAPHPPVLVHALVPYTRGDLVARAHELGEVITCEHLEDGTLITARVPAALAAVMESLSPLPAAVAVDDGVDDRFHDRIGDGVSDLAQDRRNAS